MPTQLSAARRRAPDDGSLPLALLAIIVVVGIVTALMSRMMANEEATAFDRGFTEVLHAADAGLQEAYFKLNTGTLKSTVGIGGQTAVVTGSTENGAYRWVAERQSHRGWVVRSTGQEGGIERTVVADVVEIPRFFPGAFGDELVSLNGQSSQVDSYESTTPVGSCPSPAEEKKCWGTSVPFGTGNGALGTNEDFDFEGNAVVNRAVLYNWAGYPGTGATDDNPGGSRCEGNPCTADVLRIEDDPLNYASDDAMKFIFDKLAACTADQEQGTEATGWIIGGTSASPDQLAPYDADPATPPPGVDPASASHTDYYCADRLTIDGDVELTGASATNPVVIFVRDSVKVSKSGTLVNCPGCQSNDPRGTRPLSPNLQIYLASDLASGGANVFIKSQSMFAGTIYGPRARCGTDAGEMGSAGVDIYGSLVCGSVEQVGNWKFHFDDALGNFGTNTFAVSAWLEDVTAAVPPS